MIQGLDHIAIIISNENNLEFYKKFGFVETRRFTRAYDTVVFMECTGNTINSSVVLEIFIDKNHPARVSNPEAIGLRHIAFTVTDLDEMAKLINNSDTGRKNVDFGQMDMVSSVAEFVKKYIEV